MHNEKLIKKIYIIHIKQLKNINVPHKKFIIVFSGIPGSGKTYIAKILEKRYEGVRMRTDDIRKIIVKVGVEGMEKREALLKDYYLWILSSVPFRNKLIILDKGIDRKYKVIFDLEKEKGYKVFTIRIKASRKVLEKRIFERNNRKDPHFDSEINRWTREWKAFGKKAKPSIVIENEENLNLEPLFLKLDKLVK